jgi:hypothetical protein
LLLADPDPAARSGAAIALGLGPSAAAEPLLRYKLLISDAESHVLGDCFRSLLAVSPGSVSIVAAFLGSADEALGEQAALALGESRLEGAFAALRELAEASLTGSRRRVILLAIALLRRDDAVEWLLGRVAEGEVAAVDALGIYRHDASLRARVAAEARAKDVKRAVAAIFGTEGKPEK